MDSSDVSRSSRQMASPPRMVSGDLDRGSTTIWTGDNSVEETPESIHTGNDVIHNSKVATKCHPQSALNIHRQSVKDPTVSTPIFSLTATEVRCRKNEDNNGHFHIREESRDTPLQNFPQAKTLPRKRPKKQSQQQRNNSILQRIPEIAERCERSVSKCEQTLAMMNELLRTSQMENFWLRWNLQEMGPRISQSEYNATFMPTGMNVALYSD